MQKISVSYEVTRRLIRKEKQRKVNFNSERRLTKYQPNTQSVLSRLIGRRKQNGENKTNKKLFFVNLPLHSAVSILRCYYVQKQKKNRYLLYQGNMRRAVPH